MINFEAKFGTDSEAMGCNPVVTLSMIRKKLSRRAKRAAQKTRTIFLPGGR